MSKNIKILPLFWNLIVVATACWAALFIPYDLVFSSFGYTYHEYSNWTVVAVFIIDIFFNIFYHDTFIIVDSFDERQSADKYINSYFVFDVMAALPLGVIFNMPILQLFHLAKFVKVGNLMHRLKLRMLQYANTLTMVFFLFWMGLSAHFISIGWLALRGQDFELAEITNYIQSLYWAVTTLTTVGYGDITPNTSAQMIYTIFVMILGVGIYGYVIGNIASILSKRDPSKLKYSENLEKLSALVANRNLPLPLQKRIQDYYKYVHHKRMGYDEIEFLKGLPKSLQTEVSLFLKKEVIENNQLFKGANKEFVEEISLKLKPVVLIPGDCLFKKNDIGDEMYFVVKGTLIVFGDQQTGTIATLTEGSYFGEIALFKNVPRTATIYADSYCDLYSLNKNTFDHVISKYPDIASKIAFLVEKRQNEL
ncbi:MAG: cyclic nucleotide-binding domain-containing protein [Bacteroidetes bacterium]|nr:cyclic nucleotide-binding domain-containing protein [Bacteroidota bacterium]